MTLDRRTLLSSLPFAGAIGAGAIGAGAVGAGAIAAGAGLPQVAAAGTASPGAFVNAADFGLIANEGRDATARLQAAIDSLAGTGGILSLSPGQYLASSIQLPSGVILQGAGLATVLEGTGQSPLIEARGATGSGLAALTLQGAPDGGGDPLPVVKFTDTEHFTINRIAIRGGGRGLELEASSGTVTGSHFTGMADVAVFSINATGLDISGNTIEDCGNNGLQVWRSLKGHDGTLITGNRIRNIRADAGGSGQYGNGINVFRAGGVLATGNRIENCAYSAFRSNAGSDCQFTANSCTGLGEVAIYAEFGFEGAIIASNLVEDAASGISITNFNEGGRLAVVTGNLIRNLRTRDHFDARGNGIGAEADTLIANNVIENAPAAGITLGWGNYLRDVLVTGNLVRTCRWGITVSVSPGAGSAAITSNMISGAKETAVQAMDHERTNGGELVSGKHKWPHLTISGNVKT